MKLGFTYVTTPSVCQDHRLHINLVANIDYSRWQDVPDTYVDLGAPNSYQVETQCGITAMEFTKLVNNIPFCELLDENRLYFIAENESEKETIYLIRSRKNRERLLAAFYFFHEI